MTETTEASGSGSASPFDAWRGAWRFVMTAPLPFIATFIALTASGLVAPLLFGNPTNLSRIIAMVAAQTVFDSLMLSSLAIFVHRFIVLGEINNQVLHTPFSRRFVSFYLNTVIWYAILYGVVWFFVAWISGRVSVWYWFILPFLLIILLFRLLLFFPARALDSRSATWRNADSDAHGHTIWIALLVIVTALPNIAFFGAQAWLEIRYDVPSPTGAGWYLSTALQSFNLTVATTVLAALVSRFYQELGAALKRVPAEA